MLKSGPVLKPTQRKGLLMSIRDEIKGYASLAGKTLKFLYEELDKLHNRETTYQNFVKKLARESLSYKEVKEIAEILGYEIVWNRKAKQP